MSNFGECPAKSGPWQYTKTNLDSNPDPYALDIPAMALEHELLNSTRNDRIIVNVGLRWLLGFASELRKFEKFRSGKIKCSLSLKSYDSGPMWFQIPAPYKFVSLTFL